MAEPTSKVTVENSKFHSNAGAYGAVIALATGVDAKFSNCRIEEGMARFGGVATYFGPASLEFKKSKIRANRATENGTFSPSTDCLAVVHLFIPALSQHSFCFSFSKVALRI
jgi:hypothetical protein